MNSYRPRIFFPIASLVLCLFLAVSNVFAPPAGDFHLEAQLVWGTNDSQSSDPAHKPVEPTLAEKLSKSPYKWKNYFEISRQKVSVASNATKTIKMSEHCVLDVKNVGDGRIEVKLRGDGKLVSRHLEPLPPGQTLIVAGDAKNDTAWLVVLKRCSEK